MSFPEMLLISEKDTQLAKYKDVYFKHKNEIPFNIYFANLQGHIDEIKEGQKEKWSFENALNIPDGFKCWNFKPNAINAPEMSPYQIKKKLKKYQQYIINLLESHPNIEYLGVGTDTDIEGSYLASAFISTLPIKYQKLPRLRLFSDDDTEEAILDAFKHMHKETELMTNGKSSYSSYNNSGILRGQVNYVMGTSLTRALTLKSGSLVQVGYVKAPIIQLVDHRYQQFIHFKPQYYYQIESEIQHQNGSFKARLVDAEKKQTIKFRDKKVAEQKIELLKNFGQIEKQETNKRTIYAPQFFKYTQLQAILKKKYNMSLSHSESLIEKIYHEKELITYPRTDSVVVGKGRVKDFPQMVKMCMNIPPLKPYAELAMKLNRFDKVANQKRFVNDKKVEIHPALTLSTKSNKTLNWNSYTKDEQQVIYEVALRTLMPFLEPKETATTTITINTIGHDKIKWLATGTIILKAGWSELIHSKSINDELKSALPNMSIGDNIKINPLITEHETKPKPLYTIPSLIEHLGTLSNLEDVLPKSDTKLLKDFAQGIGTTSTRSSIITELINNGTLTETTKKENNIAKGSLIPTKNGSALAQTLNKLQIMQIQDVVNFEMDLTYVQHQELTPETFQEKYFKLTEEQIERIKNADIPKLNMDSAKKSSKNESLGICPICGGNIYERKNSYKCENNIFKKNNNKWIHDGCSFIVNKYIYKIKKPLTRSAIKRMLKNGETGFLSFISKKNNKEFKAKLIWNNALQKIELSFD